MPFAWTPARMDQLERAIRGGLRVALTRRGTEFIVMARRVETSGRGERLVAVSPVTGDELLFELAQVEAFEVLA